jgi:hypothetical protein
MCNHLNLKTLIHIITIIYLIMIIIIMRGENFVAHLDGLGGTLVCRRTPVAHHCSSWVEACMDIECLNLYRLWYLSWFLDFIIDYGLKLSWWLNAMKSSRVISHVSMELESNVSETVSVSIIRLDVMSDMTAHCICTHNWLLEPCVLVREPVGTMGGVSRSVIPVITQFVLCILDVLGCQLLLILSSIAACWLYITVCTIM